MAPSHLWSRQDVDNDGLDDGSWWYYSETAFIIKWVVTGVILLALLVFFLGGYWHVQRRLKRNQPPLRYHKWMVGRRQRALYPQFFPQQTQVYYHRTPYGHGQAVPMNNYGPAPPTYAEHDYVPPYEPPQGGTKVNPDQNYENVPLSGPSQPATASYR